MKNTLLTAACSMLLLTGCLTKEVASYNTYTLQIKPSLSITKNQINKSIYVAKAKSLASLNNTQILYSKSPYSLESYALSRWSDTPARMLQQKLTQYLSAQDLYVFVTSSKLKTKANIEINSEIIEFKQVFEGNKAFGLLKIRLYVTENKKTIAKDFSYKKESNTDAQGAVNSLNELSNQFIKDAALFIQQNS